MNREDDYLGIEEFHSMSRVQKLQKGLSPKEKKSDEFFNSLDWGEGVVPRVSGERSLTAIRKDDISAERFADSK